MLVQVCVLLLQLQFVFFSLSHCKEIQVMQNLKKKKKNNTTSILSMWYSTEKQDRFCQAQKHAYLQPIHLLHCLSYFRHNTHFCKGKKKKVKKTHLTSSVSYLNIAQNESLILGDMQPQTDVMRHNFWQQHMQLSLQNVSDW